MTLPIRSRRSPARTVLRFGLDVSLGMAIFLILLGSISFGHSEAQAGAAGWVTHVSVEPENRLLGFLAHNWKWVSRDSMHMLLTLTFGLITAVNLALARHLRRVSLLSRSRHRERP